MSKKIICLVENDNIRIRYIVSFILQDISAHIQFVTREYFPRLKNNLVFSYLSEPLPSVPNILYSNLLMNDKLCDNQREKITLPNINTLYQSIDYFAIAFHILTRSEEYNINKLDQYGRYLPENSIIYETKYFEVPYIDLLSKHLIQWLETHLQKKLPKKNPENLKPIITFDIDIAWKYKGRSFLRNVKSISRDIFYLKFKDLILRIGNLINLNKDPYDIYSQIEEIYHANDFKLIFFIQLNYNGKYDKQVNINKSFKKLLKYLSTFAEIGLHPSFEHGQSLEGIAHEKHILEQLIEKKVNCSRHHFLRIRIPETYRMLIEAGISDDYTMAFASTIGWRAGTCKPFSWFDLQNNTLTTLVVHPTTFMDGTLRDYLKLNYTEAFQIIQKLYNITRELNGQFIALWHNESISESGRWKNWNKKVFLPMINMLKKNDAVITK